MTPLSKLSHAVLLVALASITQAQNLVVFDFNGQDLANNGPITATLHIDDSITTTGWDFGAGLSPVDEQDNRLAFTQQASANLSTLADSIADGEYLSCTLTPQPEINLGGQRMSFSTQRISYWSPRQYSVLTSIDNFAAPVFTSTESAAGDYDIQHHSLILPLTGYDNLTAPVEIRIYVHQASYNNHSSSLTAFSITDPGPVFPLNIQATHQGSVQSYPDSTFFTDGEQVTLTAMPPAGHRFSHWQGSASSQLNPLRLTISAATSLEAVFQPIAPNKMSVAMNLASVTYWTTAWTFTNVMRCAGPWASMNGNQNPAPPQDAQGYPLEIPYDDGTGSLAAVQCIVPNLMPGNYTLNFEGTGTLYITGAGIDQNLTITATGGQASHTVPFNNNGQNILFRIIESSTADPIRNIRLHMPGFDDSTTFHPDFLEKMANFSTLRFMDWGETNSSPVSQWNERTLPNARSQARPATDGVALEHQIALANTLGKSPWICIPHLADDNYVTQAANLLRDSLDSNLQVYVEYSNETWNGAPSFIQTYYTREQGLAMGLSTNAVTAGNIYHSMRSAQIWNIFRTVFQDGDAPSRVINVAAAWAAQTEAAQARLLALNDPTINPTEIAADVLAIAPYFGHGISQDFLDANGYPTIDAICTTLSQDEIQESTQHVREHKALADLHGLRLVCYEGGQHWVNASNTRSDNALTAILTDANRDPRMGQRYIEYLDMLNREGVDLFANFLGTQGFSATGSWGIWEYQDQPLAEAPKAAAILEWIADNPIQTQIQVSSIDESNILLSCPLYPSKRYSLEASDDLDSWIAQPSLQAQWGNGEMYTETFPIPQDQGKQFFRLRLSD
ncbi:InlB B-repeat-containing protein [Rubritalea sp.]|uniref:InlB B-repeat-containing protein n=1 Tax=Rubritalea sp. TaxID=2109375 RepID=UPI003EF50EEF